MAADTDIDLAVNDLGPLAWVLDELRKSLDTAWIALRRFVRDADMARGTDMASVDAGQLRIARQHLHQAVGALEMVGLAAPAHMLRAMEAAAQRFVENPGLCNEAAATKIERAGHGLTDYLEAVLMDKPVSAVALFPQYRDVQELAGADRVHPADLWTFDWRWVEPALVLQAAALAYEPALRSRMDQAVLKVVKGADAQAAHSLMNISLGLAAAQRDARQPRIFWILAAAYFEALSLGLLPNELYAKRAASRILLQYATLAKGELGVSDRLAQDLLFFCAQAVPPRAADAPVLAAVRQAWALGRFTPVDYQKPQFGRFDPTLLAQARKRISAAKETWSVLSGGDVNKLRAVSDQFNLVADSLTKLQPESASLAQALANAADATVRSAKAPSAELAMEVATAVLYLEATFEDMDLLDAQMGPRAVRLAERLENVRGGGQPEPLETWMEELYRRVSDRQTMGSVVGELRSTLTELEKLLDQFFRNPADKVPLRDAPAHLSQMRGVLSVLGLDQASQAVLRMRESVEEILVTEIDEARARAAGTFDKLGNNLGALGFLIDMLNYQPVLAKKLFAYDDDLGELRPVMGRAAAGAPGAATPAEYADSGASPLSQEVLAVVQGGHEDGSALSLRLDSIATHAVLADQPALAHSAREASAALSAQDAGAASAALSQLAAAVQPAAPAATAPSGDAGIEEDDLRDIFLEEAREVTQSGLEAIGALTASPTGNAAELTTLRRAFHTLKGSSRMVGLTEFGEAGWSLEQLVNTWLADQKPISDALLGLCGEAMQGFGRWVEDIATGNDSHWKASMFRGPADALRTEGRRVALVLPEASAPALPAVEAPDLTLDLAPHPAPDFSPAPAPDFSSGPAVDPAPAQPADDPFAGLFDPVAAEPAAGEAAAELVEEPAESPLAAVAEPALPASVTDAFDFDLGVGASAPIPAGEALAPDFSFDMGDAFVAPPAQAATTADLPVDLPAELPAELPVEIPADAGAETGGIDFDSLFAVSGAAEPATASPEAGQAPAFADLDGLVLDLSGDSPADLPEVAPEAALEPSFDLPALEPDAGPVLEDAPQPDAEAEAELEAEAAAETAADAEPAQDPDNSPAIDEQIKVIGPLRIGIPLYNVYLNEADEWSRRLVTEVSEWALELNQPVADSTVGLAHALAGASATVGFHALSDMARSLEGALMHAQPQLRGLPEQGRVFSAAAEDIRRLLHQFAAGFLKDPDAHVMHDLQALRDLDIPAELMDPPESQPPAPAPEDAIDFSGIAAESGSEPAAQAMAPPEPGAFPVFEPLASDPAAIHLPAAQPLAAAAALVHAVETEEEIDVVDAVDPDLFPIFEEEGAELMPQLSGALRQWAARPDNRGARDEVLRALHTIKGSARLAGALRMGEMAHNMESQIERIGSDTQPQPAEFDGLLHRLDSLQSAFDTLRASGGAPAAAEPAGSAAPPAAVETTPAAGTAPVARPGIALPATSTLAPLRQASNQSVRVRSQLLDRLVNQAGEVMITRSRLEAELSQLRSSLADLSGNLDRLRQQLRDIELQAESQMQSRLAQAKDSAAGFDPLEFDRFTRVQELTRMMAESVNDVATVQRNLQRTVEATEDDLIAQARQTRELQRDLLRTRMVEFEGISERLYRVVRQAGKDAGKQVKLDITGGSIEMDRGVLDRMTPAFEHLLRNCVAHGIEDAAERVKAGKEPVGTIVIDLHQEGNDVSVAFRDDGAGLNLPRIRDKALQQGLIAVGQQITDADAANLIFMPGFSTAAEVTELAGRGVGMDVVRAEINALGGRIETSTQAGQGTSFKLVLPLTTAVTQVVMLRTGNLTIGVPANLVEIVRRTTAAELAQAYASGNFDFGGVQLPFYWSGALLQSSARSAEAQARTLPVVIFRSAAQRVAVHVDEVLGNQEVVVKNLGPQLVRLPGLAGMTVLASGAVVLIYNPVALSAVYGEQARKLSLDAIASDAQAAADGGAPVAVQAVHAPQQVPLVMVVDDSITVRRVTQRLLLREGYRVVLAADGLQALERLADELPAVVLSDIEMPRMDGFDLARNIRADARLRGLPIIMITSRIAEKHREHAMELGVNHYLGKPYAEDELLGLVRHLSGAELTAAS